MSLLKQIAWRSAGRWTPDLRRLRPYRRHEELMTDALGGKSGGSSEALDLLVAGTKLIKARAMGVRRSEMAKHLGWSQKKATAVWRSVSRYISANAEFARAVLLNSKIRSQ